MNRPKRYLCVEIGKQRYAIPLSVAKEVTAVRSVIAVFGSNATNLGLINLRGNMVSLFDLRNKLNSKQLDLANAKAIILDSKDFNAAVVVDRIGVVLDLDESEISKLSEIESTQLNPCVRGVYCEDSQPIYVIDIGGLFNISFYPNELSKNYSSVV